MASLPAPVGGTPLSVDKLPSIIAAALYASLIPLAVYRLMQRRSRTIILIGSSILAIERTVFFTLRALEASKESMRFSLGLTSYAQTSLAMGFIGITFDTTSLLRCALVNQTFGSAMYYQSPSASTENCLLGPPPSETPDNAEERRKLRFFFGLLSLEFLLAVMAALMTHLKYSQSVTDQYKGESTALCRFISTALIMTLATVLFAHALRRIRLARVSMAGLAICLVLMALVMTVACYRLIVFKYRIDSLTSPSPLNSTRAKYLFYLLHILPEWLAACIILGCNTRRIFGTGLWGDWRWVDERKVQ